MLYIYIYPHNTSVTSNKYFIMMQLQYISVDNTCTIHPQYGAIDLRKHHLSARVIWALCKVEIFMYPHRRTKVSLRADMAGTVDYPYCVCDGFYSVVATAQSAPTVERCIFDDLKNCVHTLPHRKHTFRHVFSTSKHHMHIAHLCTKFYEHTYDCVHTVHKAIRWCP
jgi:hypothetical protein